MKQLIFSALLCIGTFASQAMGVIITNNTPCDVYVRLKADPVAGGCPSNYVSGVFTIPGGGGVLNITDPSATPGGVWLGLVGITATGGWFGEIEFIECDPGVCTGPCTGNIALIDYCSLSSPYTHSFYDAACLPNSCGTANITATSNGTDNIIDVN